jgi:hypothetical protein
LLSSGEMLGSMELERYELLPSASDLSRQFGVTYVELAQDGVKSLHIITNYMS